MGRNEDGSLFIAGDYYLAVTDAETGAILSSLNGSSIQNGAIGKGNRSVATDPLYRAFWVVANDDLNIQKFSLETFAFEDQVFYPEGTLISIPQPATDEVTLLRETALGYEQIVISTRPQPYRLFPNPVMEALHFQLIVAESEPLNDVVFRLFDANGKVLSEQNCGGTSFSIKRQSGWTAGSYFYEISRHGEQVQSGKVMLR